LVSSIYEIAFEKKLTILIGGHGSGKSEFAIEWARRLVRSKRSPVILVDLDTIKPLFRSQEAQYALADEGIEMLISSVPSSDMPSISARMVGMIGDDTNWMVVDVGGDAAGARILKSINVYMHHREHNLIYIINTRRPFNFDTESALKELKRIESISGLKITDLVSNTHLLDETTPAIIEEGIRVTEQVSEKLGISFLGVMISDDMTDKVKIPDNLELFRIHRMLNPPWMRDYR